MRIPRIFTGFPLRSGAVVELPEQAARHVTQVLRLRPGAPLVVFDGSGGEYQAVLREAHKRAVTVDVGEFVAREAESPLEIILAQGISRGERMDYTIQKAVELGVSRIVPVITARTVVQLQGERLERRLDHWRAVAIAACEQSGRNRVPPVAEARMFADWLGEARSGLPLVLHHRAERGLRELGTPAGPVTLLIGPEGGLDEPELQQARAAGFQPLCLGPRVLRTETAAVMALAAMQALWGDAG